MMKHSVKFLALFVFLCMCISVAEAQKKPVKAFRAKNAVPPRTTKGETSG
jgi:hypothetical protein